MLLLGKAVKSPFGTNYSVLAEEFIQANPGAIVETAPRGKIIIREGDVVECSILVLAGWMALSKALPDGGTQIIDVVLPGDFALIGAAKAPFSACTVEMLSDARFIRVVSAQANGPGEQMARLRELMAAEIVVAQARTSELLLRLGKGSAAGRIAYALLEFYVRLAAVRLAKDGRFHFPMTQHKIGEFTGLSNVHVCRTMRRFEREGLISHPEPSEIFLTNLPVLCDIAGIDLDTFRDEILIQPVA